MITDVGICNTIFSSKYLASEAKKYSTSLSLLSGASVDVSYSSSTSEEQNVDRSEMLRGKTQFVTSYLECKPPGPGNSSPGRYNLY